MSTPIERAKASLHEHDHWRMECRDHEGYCCPTGDAHGMSADEVDTHQARAVLTAALTDPDDPDALARVIYESTYPGVDGLPEWDEMDPQGATRLIHGIYADAVRAWLLGADL